MNYIFVVSGFTQQRYAKHGSGSVDIYKQMRKYANRYTAVFLLEWRDDPIGYARLVAANHITGAKVMVCAYSYGGGWWANQFFHELKRLGIPVDTAVLCDPVYRYPWFLAFMRWRAIRKQTLKVPYNVRRVVHFVQFKNEPGGDSLEVYPPTELDGPHVLEYPHVKMDNSPEYFLACEVEAGKLFGDGEPT